MHISTTRRPVAVVADRGGGPARTTTRPSARAIMTILVHEPFVPGEKGSVYRVAIGARNGSAVLRREDQFREVVR